MECIITKILIKKFWKRCVTLPWIAHMRYGPPLLVLTFTDDPPPWGPSPPPPPRKNVPSLKKIVSSSEKDVALILNYLCTTRLALVSPVSIMQLHYSRQGVEERESIFALISWVTTNNVLSSSMSCGRFTPSVQLQNRGKELKIHWNPFPTILTNGRLRITWNTLSQEKWTSKHCSGIHMDSSWHR